MSLRKGAAMKRTVLPVALLILLSIAAPVGAQQLPTRLDAGSATVGFGFARLRWNGCCGDGFMVDFGYDLVKREEHALGVVVDFGRGRFEATAFSPAETDMTVTGGVRALFLRGRRINVQAQGTAGVVRWKERDGAGNQLSAGVDPLFGGGFAALFNLNEYLALKAQWDFWGTRDAADWDVIKRFVFAGVFRFGGR
jgi:hypothetical protein